VNDHKFNLPVCPYLSDDGKGAYKKVVFKLSKKEVANIMEKMLKLNFWH
jgi:hypothetical protein